MKILRGGRPPKTPCEACGRVVTPGRKHKAGRHRGDCPGFVPDEEKRHISLYVEAVKRLGRLGMEGHWAIVGLASSAALEALGVDPKTIPYLERWRAIGPRIPFVVPKGEKA